MAISEIMLGAVRDFVQAPHSPNLYFALTSLPRPLIDFRRGYEVEREILYLSFPELRDLKTRSFTQEQLQSVIDRFIKELGPLSEGSRPMPRSRIELTALAIEVYPEAKQRLIQQGWSLERIEAMPVFQVVMIDALQTYEELRDQVLRWMYLPYSEGSARVRLADRELFAQRDRETIPFASNLVPAVQGAFSAEPRLERQVAMFRIVEAIRGYAESHGGRLPKSLHDVEYPMPNDPFTSEEFQYSLADGTARLTPPSRKDKYSQVYFRQFEIRMAKENLER
jgi:hypothetical protein